MAWPDGALTTTHLDAGSDDPSQARAEIEAAIEAINAIAASRGVANGVASLDAGGKVPVGQLNVSTLTAADAPRWAGAARTVSTSAPSGGQDGDLWFQYID